MNTVNLQDVKLTQKFLAFLYTNTFTIAMKRIKYLEIYLPKETKDLYI